MTFFEAAVEVLREAGRPLHFKKIAAQAVNKGLLSHVGKSPEDTMGARLSQEATKPAEQSVIEEVRPNVFGLRAGVDLDDAIETISLRPPTEDEPEPEPVEQDAEVEDLSPVSAPTLVRSEDNDRRRGRRRSRRGGKGRPERDDRDGRDERSNDSEDDDAAAAAPTADPVELDDDLSDVAAAAVAVLEKAKGRPYSASKVANELAKQNVGALSALGAAALRSTLNAVNEERAHEGRPPVFEEAKPNFWALATASGNALASSYDALEQWQVRHRAALIGTLSERLGKLDETALGSLVTLLLDRLGYTDLQAHEDGPITISARSPKGLTITTVAVRLFASGDEVGRTQVAELRGSLHQFGATAGVIFAPGDIAADALDEIEVPNVAPISLLDASSMADLMARSGVGVGRFTVDVSCLDDALFRELTRR